MFSLFGRHRLEKQILKLAEAGLRLNDGVSIQTLLTFFPRSEFEGRPYDLLLFVLGSDIEERPWGRYISDDAWNFDLECIDGAWSYQRIIDNLLRIAKRPGLITDVIDGIEAQAAAAGVLSYSIEGVARTLDVKVEHDWADAETVTRIMGDISDAIGDGRRYWGADNGQASIVFFLSNSQAAQINRLARNRLALL